jgi:hypothetical protein
VGITDEDARAGFDGYERVEVYKGGEGIFSSKSYATPYYEKNLLRN